MAENATILSADDAEQAAFVFRHPLDSAYGCRLSPISRIAGLESGAINHVSIAPGEQGFPLHRHHGQEEWVYVLSGEGEVLLDESVTAVGPGAFVVFPAAKEAHAVRNAGKSDLVCLMGGTAPAADVIDLPELGHRVIKSANGFEAVHADAFTVKNPFPNPKG